MPFALIPFLLLVVPVVEIAAFIAIGGQIGIGPTLLMILVTAVVGTFLLRRQGFQILKNFNAETAAGRIPGRTLGDGAMILVAGILLLTPGFVTDSIGFALFVPFVRNTIWNFLSSRISVVVPGGDMFSGGRSSTSNYGTSYGDEGPVIDLDEDEYRTGETDNGSKTSNQRGSSPWRSDEDRHN